MQEEITKHINDISLAGNLTLVHAVLGLFTAFALTFILALIYKVIHREKEDCHVIMHSMIFISVILAGAMMVIGNNLAIAFGLVGAVSIIRFRTAVRNYIDMSFIFVSIVVGMASGLDFYSVAVLITLFVGALMLVLNFLKFGMSPPTSNEYILTLEVKGEEPFSEDLFRAIEGFENFKNSFIEYRTSKNRQRIKYKINVSDEDAFNAYIKALDDRFKDNKYDLTISVP